MSDTIIRLDVGGVHYTTTKSTLCRVSGSMLERMFNGSIDSKQIDGRYFIDRNGQLFQQILDYLRDGETWAPPSKRDLCKTLLREAQFFCLVALTDRLTQVIQSLDDAKSVPRSREAFIIALDEKRVVCFDEVPPRLQHWDNHQVEGYTCQACHEIIYEAAQLGYTLTSLTVLPKRRISKDGENVNVSNTVMLGFQSN